MKEQLVISESLPFALFFYAERVSSPVKTHKAPLF